MGKILWDSGYWDDELARMELAAKDATERQLKDGEGRSAWTSTYLSDNPGSNFFSIIAVVATDAPLVPHQVSDPYWSGKPNEWCVAVEKNCEASRPRFRKARGHGRELLVRVARGSSLLGLNDS